MGWLAAMLASMVLADPLLTAASCGPPDARAMSRPLFAALEVPKIKTGDDADPARRGGAAEPVGGDVEGYLRLHSEVARGETRSLLMPWPELRSLAAVILPSGRASSLKKAGLRQR